MIMGKVCGYSQNTGWTTVTGRCWELILLWWGLSDVIMEIMASLVMVMETMAYPILGDGGHGFPHLWWWRLWITHPWCLRPWLSPSVVMKIMYFPQVFGGSSSTRKNQSWQEWATAEIIPSRSSFQPWQCIWRFPGPMGIGWRIPRSAHSLVHLDFPALWTGNHQRCGVVRLMG